LNDEVINEPTNVVETAVKNDNIEENTKIETVAENTDNNISLEIDDLELKDGENNLEEFEVNLETLNAKDADSIKLRQPNEVYHDIWREARKRAKNARKTAIAAYLEAKNIKTTYMIGEIDDTDSEDEMDKYINTLNHSEMDKTTSLSLG
jgi:hypothetical protein